jgi:hypothetical protein
MFVKASVAFFLHIYIIKNKLISMITKQHVQEGKFCSGTPFLYMVLADVHRQPSHLTNIYHYKKACIFLVDAVAIKIIIIQNV